MFGNFSLIEIIMIAAALYMGFAGNQAVVNQKWAVFIVAAILLLLLFIGPPGTDQTSPLSGFNLTVGGFNFLFLGIVAVLLWFIYSRSEASKPTKWLWFVLALTFFLSAGGSSALINF